MSGFKVLFKSGCGGVGEGRKRKRRQTIEIGGDGETMSVTKAWSFEWKARDKQIFN